MKDEKNIRIIVPCLKRNEVCYGGLPQEVKDFMDDGDVTNFVIRGESDWHHLASDHVFKNSRTYRLNKDFKLTVYIPFITRNGLLGFDVHGLLLTYDASCSLIKRNGDKLRFMGYIYTIGEKYKQELIGQNGEMPIGGVWDIL